MRVTRSVGQLGQGIRKLTGIHMAPTHRVSSYEASEGKVPDISAVLGDLDMPEIDQDLETYQEETGAVFLDGDAIPVSYGNDSKALHALEEGAVVMDVSNNPRLRVSGPDATEFFHGQTSVDVKSMTIGSSMEACILTPQGRIIDLVLLVKMESGVLLVCSPGMGEIVKSHLEKHIFMNDQVEVMDISGHTKMFRVMGPNSNDILFTLKASKEIVAGKIGSCGVMGFDGKPLVVIKRTDLGYSGYTLIVDEQGAPLLWKNLNTFQVEPMGTQAWEIARVLSGRPSLGHELNEKYTPFDAGLCHTVSLNKGCYVGQEALSKIHNLDASRYEIWGISIQKPCAVGDKVFAKYSGDASGKKEVGVITSYVDTPSMQHRALAYLNRRVLGSPGGLPKLWNGASIMVGEQEIPGQVVNVPYPQRSLSKENMPVEKIEGESLSSGSKLDKARDREKKLKLMQARLDEWKSA
eukprot:jgi/Picsp_1/3705/NSC_06541-R1_aminomethyltransferase